MKKHSLTKKQRFVILNNTPIVKRLDSIAVDVRAIADAMPKEPTKWERIIGAVSNVATILGLIGIAEIILNWWGR